MIIQPLFGQDSSPHKTSFVLSLAGTFLFWLIFLLISIFVKFTPKKQFKEVQIVLTNEKLDFERKKSDSASSLEASLMPAEEPVVQERVNESVAEVQKTQEVPPLPPELPSPPKPVESVKPVVQKKEAASEKPSAAAKDIKAEQKVTEPVEYAKSVDELMREQLATKKTSAQDFDWDAVFGDSPSESPSSAQTQKVNTASEVAGSAGSVSQNQTQSQTSQSTAEQKNTARSGDVRKSLEKISKATYSSSSGNGDTKSISTVNTSSLSDGKVSVEMSDGSTRVILEPSKPVIALSDSAARLIEGDRSVSISFRVMENGNVPRSDIVITPESVLPEAVREEIRNQLSKWRFEAAGSKANAVFEFTIIKQ